MEGSSNEVQQLLTSMQEIESNIKLEQIPKKVILLMGQTKAGKTTLYYYLLGKKLLWQKNELDVWQMRPQTKYFIAQVGSGYDSTTVYPNIPMGFAEDDTMIIDMPGFDDNRPLFRLLNIYILLEILKLVREVHICHVIPEQVCDSDGCMREFEKISCVFNKNILLGQHYLSFMITKVENEQIKDLFVSQIDDLIESQLISHLEAELTAFKQKNIYVFANEQPDVERGVELKERIERENSFYCVNNEPSAILSQSYAREMIGTTNIQQFSDYLITIIDNIKHTAALITSIYHHIIMLHFQQIIASALRTDQQLFAQEHAQGISAQSSQIELENINNIAVKWKEPKQINKQHILSLLKCFQKPSYSKTDDDFMAKMLMHFSTLIQFIRNHHPCLDEDYLSKMKAILKGISNLIWMIMEVRVGEIEQKLKEVTKNESILNSIESIDIFWQTHHQAILGTEQFSNFCNDLQIVERLEELNLSIGEEIIHKVARYKEPRRHKQIADTISKMGKHAKNTTSHHYQDISTAQHPEGIDKLLRRLPITHQTLKYLKNQYDRCQPNAEKWLLRKLLNKISQIFYWFSYIEEAIMFKMTTTDENGIEQYLMEGTGCGEISADFTQSILIPYYSQINASAAKLQTCFNYLLQLAGSPSQMQALEVMRVQVLERMCMNPELCYLMLDRYKQLELYYIDPIMQRFEYYLQGIQRRQQLFNRCQVASLTGFINKKMKQ